MAMTARRLWASARWRPRRAMCSSGNFTRPMGRCMEGWAAAKTCATGARRRWQPWCRRRRSGGPAQRGGSYFLCPASACGGGSHTSIHRHVAVWAVASGDECVLYGGGGIGWPARSARPGHGARGTWRPGSGRGGRRDAREVHSAPSGGPKPASACGTAAHGRPAWRPRRDVVHVSARSGAGSASPISLRPVQLQISLNF
jgi:hypothetical protein